MARLRPSRRRDARSRLAANSASAESSGDGGASVSGRCVRLSNNVLRIRCLLVAHVLYGKPVPTFPEHALQIVPRVRAVEGFIAEREIGDDVALDGGFKQRP